MQTRTVNYNTEACGYQSLSESSENFTFAQSETTCSLPDKFYFSSSKENFSNSRLSCNLFNNSFPLSQKNQTSNLSLIIFLTPNQKLPFNSSYTLKTNNTPYLYLDLAFDELLQTSLEKSSITLNNAAVFPWGLPNSSSKPRMEVAFQDGKLYLYPHYNLLIDLFIGKKDITSQILPFLPEGLKQQEKIVSSISPNQMIDWIISGMKSGEASSHQPSPLLTTLANSVTGIWGDLYFQPTDIDRKEVKIKFGKNPPQTPFQITFETDRIKNLHSLNTEGELNLQKFSIPGKIDLENSQVAMRINLSSTGTSSATIDQANINIRSFNYPISPSQLLEITNGKITDGKPTSLKGIEFPPGIHMEGNGLDRLNLSVNLDFDLTIEIPFVGKTRIQAPILLKTELKKSAVDSSYQIVPNKTLLALPEWTIQWGSKTNPQKIKGNLFLSDLFNKNSCSPEDPSIEAEKKPDSIKLELGIHEVKSDLALFKTGAFHFSIVPPTTPDHYYDFSQLLKIPSLTAKAVIQQKDGSKIDGVFELNSSQKGIENKKELKISLEETTANGVSQSLIKNGMINFSSQPAANKTEISHLACKADSFLGIEKPIGELKYKEFPEEDGWRKFSPEFFKLTGNQKSQDISNQWFQGPFSIALQPAQREQTFVRYNRKLNRLEMRKINALFSFEKIFPPPLLAASEQRYKGFDIGGGLISDGILDLKNLKWNGTLALRGSKKGDLFLRDNNGNLFEGRLDPDHPERVYPLPLFRNTYLPASLINQHNRYWSEGDFLFKSEIDLTTLLPAETKIDLIGILNFKFKKLPHSMPSGFDQLFKVFLENLNLERNGNALLNLPLFNKNAIVTEEVKLKIPDSYTKKWLETVPDLLKLIRAVKARLKGLVVNGGLGGPEHCRYSQLVEKKEVEKAECYLGFDPQTTATLEFEIKEVEDESYSQITQFRLMYDPKKPVQYHGKKVGNAFILYSSGSLLNCTGPICPGFEQADLGSIASLADIRTSTKKNEEGLSFRFITPFTAPSWDLPALNFTEDYLKGYALEDLGCFIKGADLKHRIPIAVLKENSNYSLEGKSFECRIPAKIPEVIELFSQGETDYKKLSIIDPNDCEDLHRCPDPEVEAGKKPPARPSLIDFLSSSVENGVQIETYLRDGPLRMPMGILEFTTESANREKEIIQAKINRLEKENKENIEWQFKEWWNRIKYNPNFELNQLRRKLYELETNSARLSLRADDKQITVTFKNPELKLADFSNENHQLQLKGLRAKEVRVTLPYSLPKLRELIGQKKFRPSDVQVEVIEATATEIHFSNPKTKAKLHLKTANRSDPIKLDLFSWKPNADGMEIRTSNPKNKKSGIHLPTSLAQFEISPGEIFSSEFENASMQEGLLKFNARFDRNFNLSKLTYSVEAENFSATIKKGHARTITLNGSKIQNGFLKITQDSGDPAAFPTLTARGYGVIKANPILIHNENFNIPGLRVFGRIDAEVKGNFLLHSTPVSLILESDPAGGVPIHMENGKIESFFIDQDLGQTKPGEDLKNFPHKNLIHTQMQLGAKKLQINKLEKIELLLQTENEENPIRALTAEGIELGEIEGGGEFWFSAPAYKFLRGYFPKIGPQRDSSNFYFPLLEKVKPFLELFIERKPENHSSFFRLGKIEIIPENESQNFDEKEGGTYLTDIETQLFEVEGKHQYFKLKYPDKMKITTNGRRLLSAEARKLNIATVLIDEARGGGLKFETISRDLKGLRYRESQTDQPPKGKIHWKIDP